MKKCSVSICWRQSGRSPLCRWHYRRWEKKLKKLMIEFNISRRGSYDFLVSFSTAKKTIPEEYMKIIHRISDCGKHCFFDDCLDGGCYKDLCPSHNMELRRYYHAEADLMTVKQIGGLLKKFRESLV